MTTLRLVQGLGLLMELCKYLTRCNQAGLAASLGSERSCSYGSDCVLTCAALNKPAVQYRDVRWYKETPDRRNGLLMRSLPNGPTRLYVGLSRQVDVLEDSWSILLPNVSTGDSGTYVCRLAAPVGQQNQEGRVQLAVTGGPDGPPKFQEIMFVVLATIVRSIAAIHGLLKNMLRERSKATIKSLILEAHLHPLDMNMLKSSQTLGPIWSNSSKMKHFYLN
ncbi:hypothetical protein N1851_021925 [Merluccius polli]|uniref:Ig-like domain-containing protein n=1 Tax=Merluccius polli TaxID=89951 RepID=A0AA47MIS2_MERPO|nr:hypothetical protein N1851_021925 [Merluccius polli]